ncbi:MAG: sigma-70 family RNA polymerase sigma factor [Lentisphaerae bacterium]|jgi:RNA polymerase sigma-70 factor (ECF subfamily)|nr:sigma-70 family RNA polymerase sigma factor [Lentisphaerota bacterium]
MPGRAVSEDEVLLSRYLKGDLGAFDELVALHGSSLMVYVRSMTGSVEEAEDLFQETWQRVLKNASSFRGGTLRSWIWRIAKNARIDWVRRRKPDESLDREVGDGESVLGDFIEAPGLTAAEMVSSADMVERIGECVGTLPEAQREVFLMRTVGDLSFREIAEVLEVPLNTALGRMHYAVNRLREMLVDERIV